MLRNGGRLKFSTCPFKLETPSNIKKDYLLDCSKNPDILTRLLKKSRNSFILIDGRKQIVLANPLRACFI